MGQILFVIGLAMERFVRLSIWRVRGRRECPTCEAEGVVWLHPDEAPEWDIADDFSVACPECEG